jgi:hypothetical protein
VTYVRNITDVDDKIIKRAAENGETPDALTGRMIEAGTAGDFRYWPSAGEVCSAGTVRSRKIADGRRTRAGLGRERDGWLFCMASRHYGPAMWLHPGRYVERAAEQSAEVGDGVNH